MKTFPPLQGVDIIIIFDRHSVLLKDLVTENCSFYHSPARAKLAQCIFRSEDDIKVDIWKDKTVTFTYNCRLPVVVAQNWLA